MSKIKLGPVYFFNSKNSPTHETSNSAFVAKIGEKVMAACKICGGEDYRIPLCGGIAYCPGGNDPMKYLLRPASAAGEVDGIP